MDLYATKGAINARLGPLVDRLAARGVSPDALTLAAVPVALAGGLALLGSRWAHPLLALVPLLVVARLVLNLLDGNLARRTGRIHPRGELYNEVGDRLADIAFMAPVAWLPGADPAIVLGGVAAALIASYVGLASRAAGGQRLYRGILSKPGRMVLLVACSLWALVAGPGATAPWAVFGPVLLAGAALTAFERAVVAVRSLE